MLHEFGVNEFDADYATSSPSPINTVVLMLEEWRTAESSSQPDSGQGLPEVDIDVQSEAGALEEQVEHKGVTVPDGLGKEEGPINHEILKDKKESGPALSKEGAVLTLLLNRGDLARAVDLHMQIRRVTETLSTYTSETRSAILEERLKADLMAAQKSLDSMNLSKAALEVAERLSRNPELESFLYNRMMQDIVPVHEYVERAHNSWYKLAKSDEFRKELFAFAEATDTWAPGEYMYQDSKATGEALRGLKITIGWGGPVPKRVVEEVLQAITRDGQRPGSLKIETNTTNHVVGYVDNQSFEIFVKSVDGASSVYLHEAGHLLHFRDLSRRQDQSSLIDDLWKKSFTNGEISVEDLADPVKGGKWIKSVLYSVDHPKFDVLFSLGQTGGLSMLDPMEAVVEAHRQLLYETVTHPFGADPVDRITAARYLASQTEITAELYKIYRQKVSMNALGMNPTFEELVKLNSSPLRAGVMRNFEHMFITASKEMFPQRLLADEAILAIQKKQANETSDAMKRFGVNTPQYKDALKDLHDSYRKKASDFVLAILTNDLRTTFSREPQLRERLQPLMVKLLDNNYNPNTDPGTSDELREHMAQQQRLFRSVKQKVEDRLTARWKNIERGFRAPEVDSVVIGNRVYNLPAAYESGTDSAALVAAQVGPNCKIGRDSRGVYVIDLHSQYGMLLQDPAPVHPWKPIIPGVKYYVQPGDTLVLGQMDLTQTKQIQFSSTHHPAFHQSPMTAPSQRVSDFSVAGTERSRVVYDSRNSAALNKESLDLATRYFEYRKGTEYARTGLDRHLDRFYSTGQGFLQSQAEIPFDAKLKNVNAILGQFVSQVESLHKNPLLKNIEIVAESNSPDRSGCIVFTHGSTVIEPVCCDGKNVHYRNKSGELVSSSVADVKTTFYISREALTESGGKTIQGRVRAAEVLSTVYHQLHQIDQLMGREERAMSKGVNLRNASKNMAESIFLSTEKAYADVSADYLQFKLNGRSLDGKPMPRSEYVSNDKNTKSQQSAERVNVVIAEDGRIRLHVFGPDKTVVELDRSQSESLIRSAYGELTARLVAELATAEQAKDQPRIAALKAELQRLNEEKIRYESSLQYRETVHSSLARAASSARRGTGVAVTALFLATELLEQIRSR